MLCNLFVSTTDLHYVLNFECCWPLCSLVSFCDEFVSKVMTEVQALDAWKTPMRMQSRRWMSFRQRSWLRSRQRSKLNGHDRTRLHRPLALVVGGRGERSWTINRIQKPCFCCGLISVRLHCCCEMHKRSRDDVFRQLQCQDKHELDRVEHTEEERMADKQERWKQLWLKVEALSTDLEERVFRSKCDFATRVEKIHCSFTLAGVST